MRTTTGDLKRFCSIDCGRSIGLQPYYLPDRLIAFATDCRIFVAEKNVTSCEYAVLEDARTKERDYVLSLIDAKLPEKMSHKLDIKRLRRFSGPPEWRESCPACDREEAPRLDPCLFAGRAVNRDYLAKVASLMWDGEADLYLPKELKKPILIDNDTFRVALMPLAETVQTDEYTADLPSFEPRRKS